MFYQNLHFLGSLHESKSFLNGDATYTYQCFFLKNEFIILDQSTPTCPYTDILKTTPRVYIHAL